MREQMKNQSSICLVKDYDRGGAPALPIRGLSISEDREDCLYGYVWDCDPARPERPKGEPLTM